MNILKLVPKFSELGKIIASASLAGANQLLRYHNQNLRIRLKQDASPVTIADEKSEKIITSLIKQKLPQYKIHGEEGGFSGSSDSEITIFLDPLDGTNPFIHGQKFSSVGIMVCNKDIPLASVICLPFDKELIVAECGKGAYLFKLSNDLKLTNEVSKLSVSRQSKLDGAVLYIDANFSPQKKSIFKIHFLNKLVSYAETNHIKFSLRMIGSNLNQQAQVAAGRGEVTITDCIGGHYDLAGDLIIREAGGMFGDENGKLVTKTTNLGIGSNGLLHSEILTLIKKSYKGYRGFNTLYQ